MIYVFESGSIVYDENTISDEQKSRAVAVKTLPKPEVIEGKVAQLRADTKTNTVYYEYTDIAISQPTIDDYLLDLDFRLSILELGL